MIMVSLGRLVPCAREKPALTVQNNVNSRTQRTLRSTEGAENEKPKERALNE